MREVDRLEVIREVVGKRLVQREAGERLRLSVRQVKRLVRRYRELGAKGLISGHRGRKASNAIAAEVRAEILAVVRERYEDFSPTLAWEKLSEVHGYRVHPGPPASAFNRTCARRTFSLLPLSFPIVSRQIFRSCSVSRTIYFFRMGTLPRKKVPLTLTHLPPYLKTSFFWELYTKVTMGLYPFP